MHLKVKFTTWATYLILLLAINQIQVQSTNMLMRLWVEISCKQKITENSCVKHPPSHLVSLLTKTQGAVITAGMPEHGRFWEFPLFFHPPHLLRLICLHKNSNVVSHLHLTQTACRSPQIKQRRVSQAVSEVTFERVGSRRCPSVWPRVNFLFKYLPRGNESPPTAFLTSFFL